MAAGELGLQVLETTEFPRRHSQPDWGHDSEVVAHADLGLELQNQAVAEQAL